MNIELKKYISRIFIMEGKHPVFSNKGSGGIEGSKYDLSMKFWSLLYSKLLYELGQDLLALHTEQIMAPNSDLDTLFKQKALNPDLWAKK